MGLTSNRNAVPRGEAIGTEADESDRDRVGDVARTQGDGSRGERNSATGGERAAAQTEAALLATGQSLPLPGSMLASLTTDASERKGSLP